MSPLQLRLTPIEAKMRKAQYKQYIDVLCLTGGERMLDFDSGTGVPALYLAERLQAGGGHLTCLDISQVWLDVCRNTLKRFTNVDFLCGNINELAIPEASYDAILCQFALHDVAEEERALVVAAWALVVHPSGKLFLREHLGEHGIHLHDLRMLLLDGGWHEGIWSTANLRQLGPTYEGTFSR